MQNDINPAAQQAKERVESFLRTTMQPDPVGARAGLCKAI